MNDFWSWTLGIIALLATMVAVRATVQFNINDWLKERRKQREDNLLRLCPHIRFIKEDGGIRIVSTYISLPGTLAWQCQGCGDITHDRKKIEHDIEYWSSNKDKRNERSEKIKKLARKLGRT